MAAIFTELNALTNDLYMPRVVTTFGSEVPFLKVLRAKGKKLQGGTLIRKSLAHQYTKGGAYGRGQTLDLSGENNFAAAGWKYKYYYWPTQVTRQDQLENSGPSQIHDILEQKVEVMRFGGTQNLANDLITGGGTDSSLTINELDHALDDASGTLTGDTTYGGIDKSLNSWWAGKVHSFGGDGHGPTYTNIKLGLSQAHDADVKPNFIVANSQVVDTYMITQQPQQQYQTTGEVAKLLGGFKMAFVDGIPFVADNHIPVSATETANRIYGLNTDFFDFVTHEKEDFRIDGWKEPIDQAGIVNKLWWAGNFITWDPRRHVVMYNFDYADTTT